MSKDARLRTRLYYQRHGRDLTADCADLMRNPRAAFMWTPSLVAMLKPISSTNLEAAFDLATSPPDADAWYVHLVVGDFACARRLAPQLEPLPLLCFQRGSRGAGFHIYNWARAIQQ